MFNKDYLILIGGSASATRQYLYLNKEGDDVTSSYFFTERDLNLGDQITVVSGTSNINRASYTVTEINNLDAKVTISSTLNNASTATKLATARTINGVDFDGSANITVTADANTLTGTTLKSTVVNSSLTSVGTLTGLTTSGKIETTSTASDSIKTAGGGDFGLGINIPTGQAYKINGVAQVTNATHTGDVTGSTALTIANDAVTLAKMANLETAKLIGRTTAGTGDPEAVPIVSTLGNPGVDTNIPTEKAVRDAISASGVTSVSAGNGMNFTTITGTGSVTMGTPSDITPNSTNETTSTSHSHEITGGTLCRAWVNYNQVTNTITDSFNISSVTDISTGVWELYFDNSMPNVNYIQVGGCYSGGAISGVVVDLATYTKTTSKVRMRTTGMSGPFDGTDAYSATFCSNL